MNATYSVMSRISCQVTPADSDIHRTGRFILSFQLQSMANALQAILQTGQNAGTPTIEAVVKLRQDFLKIVSGRCIEDFPEISNSSTVADLFALTSLMNGTVDAFGNPEETEEKKKFFGYERLDLAVGPFKVGLGQLPR